MGSFINIKVGSLNCRGINDSCKRRVLFDLCEKSKFTVILLQETKLDPTQHLDIEKEWKNGPILFNSVFDKKSGTIVLFNTFQMHVLNDVYDKCGRVISLDVEILGSKLHIVNFYMPNDSKEKLLFIQSSYKFIMSNLRLF